MSGQKLAFYQLHIAGHACGPASLVLHYFNTNITSLALISSCQMGNLYLMLQEDNVRFLTGDAM
jgi:hypothetical protein